jgi:hypothetical protein
MWLWIHHCCDFVGLTHFLAFIAFKTPYIVKQLSLRIGDNVLNWNLLIFWDMCTLRQLILEWNFFQVRLSFYNFWMTMACDNDYTMKFLKIHNKVTYTNNSVYKYCFDNDISLQNWLWKSWSWFKVTFKHIFTISKSIFILYII